MMPLIILGRIILSIILVPFANPTISKKMFGAAGTQLDGPSFQSWANQLSLELGTAQPQFIIITFCQSANIRNFILLTVITIQHSGVLGSDKIYCPLVGCWFLTFLKSANVTVYDVVLSFVASVLLCCRLRL